MNFEKSKSLRPNSSENFEDNYEWSMGNADEEHEHTEYGCDISGWEEQMNTHGNEMPTDEYELEYEQVTMEACSV